MKSSGEDVVPKEKFTEFSEMAYQHVNCALGTARDVFFWKDPKTSIVVAGGFYVLGWLACILNFTVFFMILANLMVVLPKYMPEIEKAVKPQLDVVKSMIK